MRFWQKGNSMYLLVVLVALIASFTLAGGFRKYHVHVINAQGQLVALSNTSTFAAGTDQHKNDQLQLQTLSFTKITPTPVVPNLPSCERDGVKDGNCSCPAEAQEGVLCPNYTGDYAHPCPDNGRAIGGWYVNGPGDACFYSPVTTPYHFNEPAVYPKYANCPGAEGACYAKPVIYLYPKKPTLVSVLLTIPGEITVSDPHYPEGGWQDVLAEPNGTLTYNGKTYHELYYESSVTKHIVPTQGLLIPMNQLTESLQMITTRYGLNTSEQDEFLTYWLPKLRELHTPYIFFSVLTSEQKDRVDHVDITPVPDTTIYFLAYFRPVTDVTHTIADPLKFPVVPPVRAGFTAVEWGGTIDAQ